MRILKFNLESSLLQVTAILKGMLHDPVFLLISASGVGFIQVFTYRSDLTVDLIAASLFSFAIMTLLGVVKHWKEGASNGRQFLEKTIIQLIVMVSVILMGYIIAIVLAVAFKLATAAIPGTILIPGVSLYWIFTGYAIMIGYHVLKSTDLIDIIFPNLLPKWFSAGFRKFRETGKYKDLLDMGGENGNKT